MMTVVEVSKDKEALNLDNAINLYIYYIFLSFISMLLKIMILVLNTTIMAVEVSKDGEALYLNNAINLYDI